MKKPYDSPKLTVHGDFAALTKAVQGGPGFDGAWNPSEKNPDHKCGNPTGDSDCSYRS